MQKTILSVSETLRAYKACRVKRFYESELLKRLKYDLKYMSIGTHKHGQFIDFICELIETDCFSNFFYTKLDEILNKEFSRI